MTALLCPSFPPSTYRQTYTGTSNKFPWPVRPGFSMSLYHQRPRIISRVLSGEGRLRTLDSNADSLSHHPHPLLEFCSRDFHREIFGQINFVFATFRDGGTGFIWHGKVKSKNIHMFVCMDDRVTYGDSGWGKDNFPTSTQASLSHQRY